MTSNVGALTRAPRERGNFGYATVEASVLKSSPRLCAARTAAWSIVVGLFRWGGRGSNPRPTDYPIHRSEGPLLPDFLLCHRVIGCPVMTVLTEPFQSIPGHSR